MKNIIKKSLVFVLSAALALSFTMPGKAVKADTYTDTFEVSNLAELTAAAAAVNSGSGHYLIKLTDDIEGIGANASFSNNTVTILGQGHYIKDTSPQSSDPTAINAYGTAVVNLGLADGSDTLILKGRQSNDTPGAIFIDEGGTVVMNEGVTIEDFEGMNYFGGGVTVQGGSFIMNGGTIDKCGINDGSVCFGGGVAVFHGGIFTMNGGTISNCYAYSDYIDDYDPNRCFTAQGGGVYVTEGSTFTMNGGTIRDCSATNFGGGISVDLSYGEMQQVGMGNIKSKFELNGGTIVGNTAAAGAGIFSSGYFYSYAGQIGTYHPGIGTPSDPGIYVNGGTITENTTNGDDDGGGIYIAMLRPSLPVRICNATITNNEANGGGGIMNFGYWTQMVIDGCTITGNSSVANGGGVAATSNSSNGYTTIKDCTITDNTSGDIGAGVYYDANSALRINGANTIQDNKYDGKQNNLNILNTSKLVSVIGDLTGSKIGLSDPVLWGDGISDEAATTAAAKLTSGYKTNNPSLVPKDAFTSDHKTWYPDYSADGNEVRLVKKTNNSKIRGGNILVDGLIGVTLWVELDATTEAEREAYSMQFTLDDHTGSGVVQTAEYDSTKTAENPSTGDTYYGFTFEDVKAPQMADEITAELLQDGDATGVEKEYSVEQYAENMINKDSTKQDYKDFLRPMLNYGAFAQKYFNYNKSDLANKNNDMSDTVYEQTVDSEYELSEEGGLSGIAVKHFGMALNDGVDLHFEFTADSNVNMDEYTAILNDDPNKEPMFIDDNDQPTHELVMPFTELETAGVKTYYVNVYNIPAHRYDDTMTVTLYKKSDPATTYKIHFSVLSYAYEIIEKDADVPEGIVKEDLVNLLKSMVLYNVWAEKYFNKYPGEYIRTKRVITEKA